MRWFMSVYPVSDSGDVLTYIARYVILNDTATPEIYTG